MHEGDSAALASRVCGRPLVGEQPVTVDQTNLSVVVGGVLRSLGHGAREDLLAPQGGEH